MRAVLCRRTSRRRLIRQIKTKLLLLALLFTVTCKKRLWVHPILKRRKLSGEFHRLVGELRLERASQYRTYFRMSPETFDELVEYVKPYITKITTNMREPIGPAERVATTLRYLATGDSYQTIAFSYRMDKSTVSKIVPETCSAIWSALQPRVMPEPTKDNWVRIEQEFNRLWQFPNCIGAIDGKHVQIQAPANSGSMFFNYKKNFSIVLLAVADAHYRFVTVDIGAYGRQSDGSVFSNSNFGRRLLSKQLDLPLPKRLNRFTRLLPHVFVADEAFPLKNNVLRPFPGSSLNTPRRVFNYRLSRARRVIENAFGIMVSRFRIFRRPIALHPARVDNIIKACVVLHNFLRKESSGIGHEAGSFNVTSSELDSTDDGAIRPLQKVGRPSSAEAVEIRSSFVQYFNSPEGTLPWQTEYINRMN